MFIGMWTMFSQFQNFIVRLSNRPKAALGESMDKFMGRELLSFIGIDKLKELYEKSTRVVSWYAHSQYDGYHPGKASVRGPYGRWMLIEGGSNGMGDEKKYPTPVADLYDDAQYTAAALNSVPHLINRIEALEALAKQMAEALKQILNTKHDKSEWLARRLLAERALDAYKRGINE